MPRGDGTGPAGAGAMTGRGAGYCAGNDRPGFAVPGGGGRGFYNRGMGGFGRGGGRGYRNQFYATGTPGWARAGGFGAYPAYNPPTSEQEKDVLLRTADQLKAELNNIEKRLQEIETKND